MISIEQQRKEQCFKMNCQYYSKHCITFHGCGCVRLGGTKIPTHRSLGHDYSYPKFVGEVDGWQTKERR